VLAPGACALLLALFIADLRIQPGGPTVTRGIDDITQLVAAAIAAGAALARAVRASGRLRASWTLVGLGAGCWAVGETFWSYYEIVASRDTPFPSLADVGYLLFPLGTGVGIALRPSRAFTGAGIPRVVLDAVLVVISLFSISWATALGEVYRGGSGNTLADVVSLAYPATDVALLTAVVIVLTHAHAGARVGLGWLGAGLAAFGMADSSFAYLTTSGSYQTGNLIDACWVGGFLLVACATVFDAKPGHTTQKRHELTPRGALLLPYLPAAFGVLAALLRISSDPDTVLVVSATATVCLLIVRQVLVLLDNRSLVIKMSHQALHDTLTGLGNRALFADRLEHALALHRRDLRPVILLLIDLDDFKTVNDTLGHSAGDELLVRVSERLMASVRAGDTVARLGGDEFAVLFEDASDPYAVAARVMAGLDHAVTIGHRRIPVTASIGMASLQAEDESAGAGDLLRKADVAMYAAKREGKGRLVAYSPELADWDADHLDLRAALMADLHAGDIDVAFQPIRSADGALHGVEALARWQHIGEPVPPATFLPLAAQLGAAARLDRVVLEKAVAQAVTWSADVAVSVNLGSATLADPGLAAWVSDVLDSAGLPTRRLTVEILESSLIEDDDDAMRTLLELRSLGVQIAVDDFGAGYASLARLHALQPDVVKIDRSLVHLHGDPDGCGPLLAGVAHLAHELGALVVAEGVETMAHRSAALAAGCDALQGFLLGRPAALAPIDDGVGSVATAG
jgi:diguanylate cyclase (GGDEF)-like protein